MVERPQRNYGESLVMKPIIIRILRFIRNIKRLALLVFSGEFYKVSFYIDANMRCYQFSKKAVETVADKTREAAICVYGDKWNGYSNALRPEICSGFAKVVDSINKNTVRYLEIGSNKGLSMSFIGNYIKHKQLKMKLVSIDPYFTDGYVEGEGAPCSTIASKKSRHIVIDRKIRDGAYELYKSLKLKVDHHEKPSNEVLLEFQSTKERFDVIYIDGGHERFIPLVDTALSLNVLNPGGFIILDDWQWRDIKPLKDIFDNVAKPIYVSWKIAAYRIDNPPLN